jgi:hypothetical protein
MWVAVPVVLGACSGDYVLPTDPGGASLLDAPPYEPVAVCKTGPAGSWATFAYTTTGGAAQVSSPFTIANVQPEFTDPQTQCVEILRVSGTDPVTVVVDEVAMSEGSAIGEIVVFGGHSSSVDLANGKATVVVSVASGALIAYKNADAPPPPPPPPPPPQGGQGCTPGYWKQPHHFDSWQGYTPTQLFSTVFGVGPSVSLLTALSTGGGGAKALGRHAVAALLNSAHSAVDYDMTTAAVIALVQNAYATGNYEAAHVQLAGFNEQSCGLN